MQPEQQQRTVNQSRTHRETKSKTEMQQAQEDDQSLNTALSWLKSGKQPHSSVKSHLGSMKHF